MTVKAPQWLGKSARAIGVVRVSSKKQGDNNSPGVQREGITAHARALGLHVVDIVMLEESAKRQRDMLLSEKHAALDRLSAASEDLDDKYLVTADRIFELAKQARTLWNQRTPPERRQLLEMVLSNPRLDGVTVRYDMKKPFAILSEMTKGNDWRARSDSNARPSDS